MKLIYLGLIMIGMVLIQPQLNAQTIWAGPDMTFTKANNADWTLSANQDILTSKVAITRQSNRPIYNYQWWQDNYAVDATASQLESDFWGSGSNVFTETGGTKGVKWAILDDTGAATPWTFSNYGTLGNPANFYSFGNICTMITDLDNSGTTALPSDDFANGTSMTDLIGKKLGVWLVDEDIYLTLTFTSWSSGGTGGGVSYIRSTSSSVVPLSPFVAAGVFMLVGIFVVVRRRKKIIA